MQNWKELSSGLLMKIFLWHNNMEDGKSTHGKDPPGLVCLLDHTGPKWLHVSFTYEHSVSCEVVVRPRPSRVISPCVCPGELLNVGLRQGHRDQWPWSPSRRNVGQEATLTGRERRTPKFPHPPTPPPPSFPSSGLSASSLPASHWKGAWTAAPCFWIFFMVHSLSPADGRGHN